MAQISIQCIAHVPSSTRNPFTGSRKFQEGFNTYRLEVIERNPSLCILREKVVIFRTSLDHKRFAQEGNLWSHTSFRAIIEAENARAEFYKTHRQEQFLTCGVMEFSQEELDAAHQVWSQIIA